MESSGGSAYKQLFLKARNTLKKDDLEAYANIARQTLKVLHNFTPSKIIKARIEAVEKALGQLAPPCVNLDAINFDIAYLQALAFLENDILHFSTIINFINTAKLVNPKINDNMIVMLQLISSAVAKHDQDQFVQIVRKHLLDPRNGGGVVTTIWSDAKCIAVYINQL